MSILVANLEILWLFCLLVKVQCTSEPDLLWELADYNGIQTHERDNRNKNFNIGTLYPGTSGKPDQSIHSYVAYFSGKDSGIDIDNVTGSCITNTKTCSQGFSLAFWIRWHSNDDTELGYIFSSKYVSMKQITKAVTVIEVGDGDQTWRHFHMRKVKNMGWQYYLWTWSATKGFFGFVDGTLTNKVPGIMPWDARLAIFGDAEKGKLALGKSVNNETGVDPFISLRRFSLWNKFLAEDVVKQVYENELQSNEVTELFTVANNIVSMSSREEDKDHVLSHHAIHTFNVDTVMQCYGKCVKYRPECKSFNYEYSVGSNTNNKTCVLNNERRDSSPNIHFQKRENFMYYDVLS